MKITKGDIVITDVPGVNSITVKRHPDAAAGVRIIIEDSHGEPTDWGLDGLTQYRDALSAAIDAARELSDQKDEPSGRRALSVACPGGGGGNVDPVPVYVVTAGGGKSSATGGRGGNSSGEPRVFSAGDVIPGDVLKVQDCEDDLWKWNEKLMIWESLLGSGSDWALRTGDLLTAWGPVTEVRD